MKTSDTMKLHYRLPETSWEAVDPCTMLCASDDVTLDGGLEDYGFDPIYG